MSAQRRRIFQVGARTLLASGLVAAGVMVWAGVAGWRVNRSASLPLGIYRLSGRPEPARGSLVLACPPQAVAEVARQRGYLRGGRCPGRVEPLGKRIVAVAGDQVAIDERGKIWVEGKEVPASEPWDRKALGWEFRTWIGQRVQLEKGEVWLFAPHPRSFDSRVFGPVPTSALRGSIEPVWVVSDGDVQKASR